MNMEKLYDKPTCSERTSEHNEHRRSLRSGNSLTRTVTHTPSTHPKRQKRTLDDSELPTNSNSQRINDRSARNPCNGNQKPEKLQNIKTFFSDLNHRFPHILDKIMAYCDPEDIINMELSNSIFFNYCKNYRVRMDRKEKIRSENDFPVYSTKTLAEQCIEYISRCPTRVFEGLRYCMPRLKPHINRLQTEFLNIKESQGLRTSDNLDSPRQNTRSNDCKKRPVSELEQGHKWCRKTTTNRLVRKPCKESSDDLNPSVRTKKTDSDSGNVAAQSATSKSNSSTCVKDDKQINFYEKFFALISGVTKNKLLLVNGVISQDMLDAHPTSSMKRNDAVVSYTSWTYVIKQFYRIHSGDPNTKWLYARCICMSYLDSSYIEKTMGTDPDGPKTQ